ncbi:autotransporter outer membrane beta-barrel domain-containing protein [Sphingosinicella soli]|uniref:Autotransporter domain-containing protein n=1 Tax=Sphingosinicella soli TaxID=333708 RepID=A0A7W7B2C0_9SPHN|nr:autotransporter domain-containing protein [Sphingosinicella soli]MBB4632701.1 hypothetical protein [Sphingosinicella soli]
MSTFRSTFRATPFIAGVSLIALAAGPAAAADLTVTGTRNTPIVTSNASSGPGNVIVDGTVEVPSGTAITVDSSHSVTVNASRTVAVEALSNSTGIAVVAPGGGLSGTITNNGAITIAAVEEDETPGSNNVGLLIGGAGTFTGNVVSGSGSTITVSGTDSQGVSVTSRLDGDLDLNGVSVTGARSTAVSISGEVTGDVTLTGGVSATGADGSGLAVSGIVGGGIANTGTIGTGQAQTTDSEGDVVPAVAGKASVLISGSVGGGFVNDRYYVDEDGDRVAPADVDTAVHTLVAGNITALGGAPAILVSPGATGTANTVVGNVGTGADAYGIINRSSITVSGSTAGRETDAIRVTGGNGFTASVGGGISNQAGAGITASAIDAAASGIRVGDGGIAPEIVNGGRITVRGSRTANSDGTFGAGGNAYGIRLDSGASVSSVTNSGTIQASSNGDNRTAYGIYSAAGISSITNSGTIQAVAGSGENVSAYAIDTSASAVGVTVNNSGTIQGAVRLGAGSDTMNVSGGTITGAISFGGGANALNISGGTVSGGLSATGGTLALGMTGGTLDLSSQDGLSLQSLNASGASRIILDVGTDFTGLDVAGAANFTGTSTIELNITDLLAGERTINVVTAGGGITTDHPDTILTADSVPYIYAVDDVTVGANAISLDLRRKAGSELGLGAEYSKIYEASIGALASEQALTTAVNNLRDEASVQAAVRQLTPTTFGSAAARVLIANQDAGFGVLGHRMQTIRQSFQGGGVDAVERARFGVWIQQTGNFFSKKDRESDPGFDGNSYGLTAGGDYLIGERAALGGGLSFISSEVKPDGLSDSPLVVKNLQGDIYTTIKFGRLFVDATAGYAMNDYRSRRVINFGGLDREAGAKFSGSQISGNLTVGYEMPLGGRLRVTPSNNINVLKVKQDGYTEDGADALNLDIESVSFDLVRGTSKLALGYGIPLGDGELWLEMRGAYIYRLAGDTTIATEGQFLATGTAFYLESKSSLDSGWRAGASANYVGGRTALGVNYDREGGSGYANDALTMSLAMHF